MNDINPSNAPAVVVGLNVTGLGVVRSLDKSLPRDAPIIGVCESSWQAGAYTRLCDRKYYCRRYGSDGLVESLIEIGKEFSVKPVLFLTDDATVLLVSKHRERLGPYYHFLLPSEDVVDLLVDKARFARFAEKNGFSVPATFIISDRDDLVRALEEIRFPCFLKPRYRGEQWEKRGYPKGFRSRTREELISLYDKIRPAEQRCIVQEWIEGSDSELYFCRVFFDDTSRCIASFTSRKLRQWPPEAGNTSMAEPVSCPEVEKETIRLYESLRLNGLGAVEFKRDASDKIYKIIEPCVGRAGTMAEIATANGVNFPLVTYAYLTKMNVPEKVIRRPVRWIQEECDLQSCLHLVRTKKLSLRELVQSYAGPKCFALFSRKDPLPLVATVLKDLGGSERRGLWSSIRGDERAPKPSTVVETADFLRMDTKRMLSR